jgi:hypothetical protein
MFCQLRKQQPQARLFLQQHQQLMHLRRQLVGQRTSPSFQKMPMTLQQQALLT